jgi:hypothetical protein
MPPAQQPQMLPPQLFQTEFIREIGRQTIAPGATGQFDLQRLGYADGLLVLLEATYDIAVGGSALTADAPFNMVNRFLLQPPGAQPIHNAGGRHTMLQDLLGRDLGTQKRGLVARTKGGDDGFVNGLARNALADLIWPAVANTAGQAGRLWYFLPFHRTHYQRLGNLPLGNQTTTSLFVTMGALADVWATPGNVTNQGLVVTVFQVVFSPPPARPDVALPSADFLFTIEEQVQAAVLGDNAIRVDPHDTILNIIHDITLNGAKNSADVNTVALQFDESFKYNALRARAWWKVQEDRLGFSAPLGVVFWDEDYMADADGAAAQALGQLAIPYNLAAAPWIHTERVATIQTTINIAATAVLGATPTIRTSIRRLARVRG